jgi:hypothetical protein
VTIQVRSPGVILWNALHAAHFKVWMRALLLSGNKTTDSRKLQVHQRQAPPVRAFR